MSQGVINGVITRLASNPEQLKAYMAGKSHKQKEAGRCHLRTVLALRGKK